MMDQDTEQLPLIRNPMYQPTKPITLNMNYNRFFQTLTKSVVPPRVNLQSKDLQMWSEKLQEVQNKHYNEANDEEEVRKFEQWVSQVSTKVAPGYLSGGVMTPKSK